MYESIYRCRLHADSFQSHAGRCWKCGMVLLPTGARFAPLRHILGSPLNLTAIAMMMLALVMTAVTLLR